MLLNTDKASKGNPGTRAGGGIIRGHRGEWIKGFAEKFGALYFCQGGAQSVAS